VTHPISAEHERLKGEEWQFFGPYLAERQWGTVREDYSKDGACWDYFPHDHARSRAYRWGEDGLLGFSDRQGLLCFGLALWNGRDPILKERLFGLGAPEGNHGEDVKELYYYLDSTPTHSYCKGLYKYPLWAYPYERLVLEGRGRDLHTPEFEIEDTGVFDRNRYVDVTVEYAKAAPRDVAIRITLANRSGAEAILHVIPQLWFRNTWSWGRDHEPGYAPRPDLRLGARGCVTATHEAMGRYFWVSSASSTGVEPTILFTHNETNMERLFGCANGQPYVKDAFHEYLVSGRQHAVNPERQGTKAGAHYRLVVPAHGSVVLHSRLASEADVQSTLAVRGESRPRTKARDFSSDQGDKPQEYREYFEVWQRRTGGKDPLSTRRDFRHGLPGLRQVEQTLAARAHEAQLFYDDFLPKAASDDERNVLRQGYASLLWSKQFYNFNVADWIVGDPAQPKPPEQRITGRNQDWSHIVNHDVISVPDKWEYPWYAAWDLAFHMIPFGRLDPAFARDQLTLFLGGRYRHPSGQLPAYEFAFGDVNPPVHAWACLRVHRMADPGDRGSRAFLARAFEPLVENFRWWLGLESPRKNHLFCGGFLGLDNIGAFDRGKEPPSGGFLEQADGTGWLAFFALTMLEMALDLGKEEPARYEETALFFFEQFATIAEAANRIDEGLWDEEIGFYFDHLNVDGAARTPLRIFSMAGFVPFFAVTVLERDSLLPFPRLRARIEEYVGGRSASPVLSLPSLAQVQRLLPHLADKESFLGPTGIRSLSRRHRREPFILRDRGKEYRVDYAPEESKTKGFGPNSNWRGPVWLPLNHLLVESLGKYHRAYGEALQVEFPKGSGVVMNALEVAGEIERLLVSTFLADPSGRRPCHGDNPRYRSDSHFKDLILFHEYFSGDTGRGLGASHQAGWTTLVLSSIEDMARRRSTNP